jgi:hypothetical protein
MTMAYVATHRDLPRSNRAEAARAGADKAVKPGFWRRLFNAVLEARQKKANEELGQYLIRSGGWLTDDIEREMNQRLSRGDWNSR